MDEKLGTELVSKNALSLINDNECTEKNDCSQEQDWFISTEYKLGGPLICILMEVHEGIE